MWWLLAIGLVFTGVACWKLISLLQAEKVTKTCGNCAHWDQKEGQTAINSVPLFATGVAPHVSPQRMMQRFDPDGNEIAPGKLLKPSENSWEAFGLCGQSAGTRCTHKGFVCDKWEKCGKRKSA